MEEINKIKEERSYLSLKILALNSKIERLERNHYKEQNKDLLDRYLQKDKNFIYHIKDVEFHKCFVTVHNIGRSMSGKILEYKMYNTHIDIQVCRSMEEISKEEVKKYLNDVIETIKI